MIDQEPKHFEFGKDLPYQVPADFFDQLPELTLKRAKERAEKRRRSNNVVRLFVLLTSAAAVVLVILLTPQRALKQVEKRTQLPIEQVEVKNVPDVKPAANTPAKPLLAEAKVETKTSTAVLVEENLDELLQGLSDEDLTLLTAMYSAEALEDEIVQETININ